MRVRSLFFGLAVGALAAPARAEPTTLGLQRLGAPAVAAFAPSHRALVTLPAHLDPRAFGLVPIVPGIAVIEGSPARLAGFSAAHPDFLVELRPPLRPKLDAAVPFIRATAADIGTARGGEGVIVGIIDTGVDLSLDDFRNEDGTTRALFYLDGAATTYGTLEEAAYLGRIYDKATIDARLGGTAGTLPGDENGHGTHVAGIAVGNGGKPPVRYVGVAPAADLIVVRAGSADGNLDEGKILAGAKFVFDMAKKLGKPAVVNLSLGTQFGAHDGTSALERSLSALAQGPGRAVVVAASNEAQSAIHTSVRIQKTGHYEIPIRLPGSNGAGAKYTSGSVYAWINARTGSFKVSVKGEGKEWLAPVEPGQGFGATPRADLTVNIVNDIQNGKPLPAGSHGAVMVVRGALPVGDLTLVIEGDADAELWLQGDGQASDGLGAAYFPHGAQLEGTIGVPASAADLIAIGCVDHRTSYTDRLGRSQRIGDVLIGRRCGFSSAGPNALGQPRPDVLAPGNYVISTLSRAAASSFESAAIVDPDHVALAGTSMSSPVGAGAVALLFQRDPTLTHEDVRALLVAGARPLVDDTGTGAQDYAKGAGVLDLRGALAALARRAAGTTAPASLQLRLGGSFVASNGSMPLYGLALVRDAEGLPTDLPSLRLELDGAVVARDALVRVAAGAYRFSVVAAPGHGLERTTLTLRGGNLVATRVLALGPDRWDARDGMKVGGGCGHAGGAAGGPGALLLVAWVLLSRRHSAAKIPTS